MKLLTFSANSIKEKEYEKKLIYFTEWLSKNDYDIVAIQEANQTINSDYVNFDELENYIPSNEHIAIKNDNYLLRVVGILQLRGKNYYWTWTPIKLGEGKYEIGIGIISKHIPKEIKEFYLTSSKSYTNYKVKKAIGIKVEIEGEDRWFFSIQTGSIDDEEEKFEKQILKLNKELVFIDEDIYLLGEFDGKIEGYERIKASGWNDAVELSEKLEEVKVKNSYIFKNNSKKVKKLRMIFNGQNGDAISKNIGLEMEE
ncbi:Uncharacterised protein [Fusobacterium necrogenes]|uniref:Uncharacterized protein n=1 Tax=Fusobacterium necrogenes TaxID=858 RepID=A0A377GVN0_9FUSO|nr:hypothetical protein [Fusobacterium necrogenes]STO30674.1 Uncharacterised protein [Fusobacterium necrogenes]